MSMVRVSSRYQVTIPRDIRSKLGVEPGQKFQALQYGDRLESIPVKRAGEMRGFLLGINTTVPREIHRT